MCACSGIRRLTGMRTQPVVRLAYGAWQHLLGRSFL